MKLFRVSLETPTNQSLHIHNGQTSAACPCFLFTTLAALDNLEYVNYHTHVPVNYTLVKRNAAARHLGYYCALLQLRLHQMGLRRKSAVARRLVVHTTRQK